MILTTTASRRRFRPLAAPTLGGCGRTGFVDRLMVVVRARRGRDGRGFSPYVSILTTTVSGFLFVRRPWRGGDSDRLLAGGLRRIEGGHT